MGRFGTISFIAGITHCFPFTLSVLVRAVMACRGSISASYAFWDYSHVCGYSRHFFMEHALFRLLWGTAGLFFWSDVLGLPQCLWILPTIFVESSRFNTVMAVTMELWKGFGALATTLCVRSLQLLSPFWGSLYVRGYYST